MTSKSAFLLLGVIALGTLAGCGGGSMSPGKTGQVTLSPHLTEVAAGVQNQTFTANLSIDLSAGGVTWSVDGVANGDTTTGVISSSGVYSAPASAGIHTITATSVTDTSKSDSATVAVTDLAGVFTYHNNLARDGTNTQEYLLSSTTVTQATFGKLFSCSVDGAVYTQPLWVPGVSINSVLHNVLYVATQHDSVYAFDADAKPCVRLWKVSLLDTLHGGTTGETPVPCDETKVCSVGAGYGDIQPEIGVTGTPVISGSKLYVVSKSENSSIPAFYQRLHALNVIDGSETDSVVNLAASVVGSGDGSSGGFLAFDPRREHQRSALALVNGTVYISWAAHEDQSPYHGWILGYNANNLAQQTAIYNSTPNGGLGGIWMGGGGPAADAQGNLYVSTGNGLFDADLDNVADNDFGDSILKLDASAGLGLEDWFTPQEQQSLSDSDADLGSGGVVLLPDQSNGPAHLLVAGGKENVLFLVDRDNMGSFQNGSNSQIVQSISTSAGLFGTPAFWQNNLYYAGPGGSLTAYTFSPSTGFFNLSPASQSTTVFNFPGASPSISSQGSSNGIVWAIDESQYGPPAPPGPAIVHAYNATNLAQEYWNSTQAGTRDQAGNAVKFVPPTIANGKVYVGTRTEVDVYGMLP
jgi:hypothetical protein